jgi:hypothetical protein
MSNRKFASESRARKNQVGTNENVLWLQSCHL